MGIEVIAYAALATTAASTVAQQRASSKANKAQKQASNEQRASNAQQAAMERRAQIREQRVKRARLLQSSENTGVSGSSGALGAESSLSSQLSSNVGFNVGQIASANRISEASQRASNNLNQANMWGQVGNLSTSIFAASGGFNSLFPADAAGAATQPANISRGGGFSPSN